MPSILVLGSIRNHSFGFGLDSRGEVQDVEVAGVWPAGTGDLGCMCMVPRVCIRTHTASIFVNHPLVQPFVDSSWACVWLLLGFSN